jgi:MerR family copper efflux transcriptional regulator
MYIGALSKITGASRKAILHYEALGLIPESHRQGRYRIYKDVDADLICMIKRAQTLGFSLKEIKDVTSTRAKTNQLPVEMVLALIESKRSELRNTITNAQMKDRQLAQLQAELKSRTHST